MKEHYVTFLSDPEHQFLALLSSPGPRLKHYDTAQGLSGQPLEHHFSLDLTCFQGNLHFSHSCLEVSEMRRQLEDKVPLSSLNDLCLKDKGASGMDGGPGRMSQLASLVQLFVTKKNGTSLGVPS